MKSTEKTWPVFPVDGRKFVLSPSLRRAAEATATSAKRRELCAMRRTLLDETFQPFVAHQICDFYANPVVQQLMCKQISAHINPGGDAARIVPAVYSMGARRFLREASEQQEEAWIDLLDQGGVWTQQQLFAQIPWATGQPMAVIPYLDGDDRLLRKLLPGDRYDCDVDDANNFRAVLWSVGKPSGDRDLAWVGVDELAWYYFDRNGRPTLGPEGFEAVEHGCVDERGEPMCPAVPFRQNEAIEDFYTPSFNHRVWDATMQAGVTWARLVFRRKVQDGKLLSIRSTSQNSVPGGQSMSDPEIPLVFTGANGRTVDIQVDDMSVDPELHLSQIRFTYEALFGAEGIPASDMTVQLSGAPGAQVSVRKERLAAVRAGRIPFCVSSEIRLAVATAGVLAGSKNDLAGQIPAPDEMIEVFGIEFPTPTVDAPKEQREQDDWDRKLGLASVVDIALRRHPWLRTRKRALEFLKRNVSEEREVDELHAAGNRERGGDMFQPTAEQNGRLGPMVRDGATPDGEAQPTQPTTPDGGGE